MNSTRQPIEQTFSLGGIPNATGVTNVANPISGMDLTSLITAFMISNFSSNASSVWLGDQTVTPTTGIEITPGSAPLFTIDEERQLYEIQNAMIKMWETLNCQPYPQPDLIPIICWNPSHLYLVTNVAGPIPVGMMFFKNVYV